MTRLPLPFRIGVMGTSLGLLGLVWVLFRMNQPLGVPAYWGFQFQLLLLISAGVAILFYLLPSCPLWLAATGFLIRGASVLIILNSMPRQMSIYAFLLAMLIFEICGAATRGIGLLTGMTLIVLMTLGRLLTNQIWGNPLAAPGIADYIIPWGETLLGLTLGFLFRSLLDQNNQLARQVEQFHQSNVRLVAVNLSLQDYTVRAQRESLVNERNRISREIHDSVGYILTNLIAVLDYIRELMTTGQEGAQALAFQKVDSAREQARLALAEVRRAVRALRPPVEVSHLQAVATLISAFGESTGIEVAFHTFDLPESLGEEYEWLIFRVIQEALTNTFRHGQANKVFITLRLKNKLLSIAIRDNGVGAGPVSLGCGLAGIQERVKALGGRFEIETAPGEGFGIKILLNWKKDCDAAAPV